MVPYSYAILVSRDGSRNQEGDDQKDEFQIIYEIEHANILDPKNGIFFLPSI